MPLLYILYGFFALIGLFLIFNFIIVFRVMTLRYVGRFITPILIIYLITLFLILVITYFRVQEIDWNTMIRLSDFFYF